MLNIDIIHIRKILTQNIVFFLNKRIFQISCPLILCSCHEITHIRIQIHLFTQRRCRIINICTPLKADICFDKASRPSKIWRLFIKFFSFTTLIAYHEKFFWKFHNGVVTPIIPQLRL